MLFEEIDEQRYETRKVHQYADGRLVSRSASRAYSSRTSSTRVLGAASPSLSR